MKQNNFIVFDGPDCSGKSTAMQSLKVLLELREIPYIHTFEPGGTEVGNSLRKLLLDTEHTEHVSNLTQMLLMLSSRNQNADLKILPALNEGKIVLCDRFSSSTYVYQVHTPEDLETFNIITNRFSTPVPITFIFNVSYETYRERMDNRHGTMDNIEKANAGKENFLRLSSRYLEYAKLYPNTYVIDADGCPESILTQILEVLHEKGTYKNT